MSIPGALRPVCGGCSAHLPREAFLRCRCFSNVLAPPGGEWVALVVCPACGRTVTQRLSASQVLALRLGFGLGLPAWLVRLAAAAPPPLSPAAGALVVGHRQPQLPDTGWAATASAAHLAAMRAGLPAPLTGLGV